MQTVLVVDDDPSVRRLLEVILAVEGFTVHSAESGAEALAIVAAHRVDLVTIDLAMPDMDGWELSAALRGDPATARIRQMLVSGEDTTEGGHALLRIDAVLAKPFDFTTFIQVLRDLLALPPIDHHAVEVAAGLDRILAQRLVTTVFQPIVHLVTGEVMAVEALSRGPEGSQLHSPVALFEAAQANQRLQELDALCHATAIEAAAASELTPPLVFVNVEPGTVLPYPAAPGAAARRFQLVVEFTERALTHQLPRVLAHAAEIRAAGNVVALDDVGVDPRSVALLPILRPEVVKLDMSLLDTTLTERAADAALSVAAYAEATGALVIAEGIETEEQLHTARSLGATWGQGFYFALPAPMSALAGQRRHPDPALRLPSLSPEPAEADTRRRLESAYTLLSSHRPVRRGSKTLLDGISTRLESQAMSLGEVGVVLVGAQHGRRLEVLRRRGYERLAASAAVLGVFGEGVGPNPLPGAVGTNLAADDPLRDEWVLLVLGPHHSAVLAARRCDGVDPADPLAFEFVVSHDRELAVDVARTFTRRMVPRDTLVRTTALAVATDSLAELATRA